MVRKNIKEKILHYFFVNPNSKLRFREIERKLNLPIPSVIKYTKELVEEGYLKTIQIGNTRFYTANKTNKEYLLEKKLYNIKTLYKSGLIDFIKKELSNPTIILFGSYSKGEDDENSDIDLFVQAKEKKLNLKKYEKLLNRKISIFFEENYLKLNSELKNNILNGIKLKGYLKVF